MKIYKAKDYQDMSRKAANIISAQVITKPDCVLGLATGSTPEGMYAQLVEWYKKGDLDFSEVKSVNLDEYRGMTRDNDQSYYYFMHKHLFDHVNIDPANTHLPNGIAEDPQEECIRYENQIKSMGGVDLQLLGMGHNGHIGFNEPGSSLSSTTRVKALTRQTRIDNARFFGNDPNAVPTHAITQGIGTIMRAKHLILLAFGRNKAHAVAQACEGGITSSCPASVIQLHPHATIILNNAAASELRYKDYYQFSYEHKPSWQTI